MAWLDPTGVHVLKSSPRIKRIVERHTVIRGWKAKDHGKGWGKTGQS